MKLILSESQINNKLLAYHYTNDDFAIGSVLHGENKNNYRSQTHTEKDLEEARKIYNPTAPNRSTCFYTSPYQKNRFARMGENLFLVEILGEPFYSDSNIIDGIAELNYRIDESLKYGRSVKDLTDEKNILIKQYWQGKINEKKNVEILSKSIKIVKKVTNQKPRFKTNEILLLKISVASFDFKNVFEESGLSYYLIDDDDSDKLFFYIKSGTIFTTTNNDYISNETTYITISIENVDMSKLKIQIRRNDLKKCTQLN